MNRLIFYVTTFLRRDAAGENFYGRFTLMKKKKYFKFKKKKKVYIFDNQVFKMDKARFK